MTTVTHSPALKWQAVAAAALLASACATEPTGPTVQVLPGQGKPFEAFENDQAVCKSYASQQVAGQVDSANEKGLGAAVLTTALGAGLGAAVGGGRGAAIGAGAGGVVGADIGANGSSHSDHSIQGQYNNAYVQCMYSKGNQIPPSLQPQQVYVTPAPVYYAYPPPTPPQ